MINPNLKVDLFVNKYATTINDGASIVNADTPTIHVGAPIVNADASTINVDANFALALASRIIQGEFILYRSQTGR